jgi:hypothetical protein
MSTDCLALTDAAFHTWFGFMTRYVNQKCSGDKPEWLHIPRNAREGLDACYTAWAGAYEALLGPHTPVDTEAKNDAKQAAKKIRPFVNQYLHFPPVTDEARTAVEVPNYDLKPTLMSRPDDVPEAEASTPRPCLLRFRFRGKNMKRRGKPKGVHGLELLWVVTEAPPAVLAELIHSTFATSNPLAPLFDENERGKRVYYAARWEINRVLKGGCGEINSAIIPQGVWHRRLRLDGYSVPCKQFYRRRIVYGGLCGTPDLRRRTK